MTVEVRRIRPTEWRQYRHLRLEALSDSPLAYIEQYEPSLNQPAGFWRDRVARSATGSDASTFISIDAGQFTGMATCLISGPDQNSRWARSSAST